VKEYTKVHGGLGINVWNIYSKYIGYLQHTILYYLFLKDLHDYKNMEGICLYKNLNVFLPLFEQE
jgi:hypothetical protein